MLNQQKKAPTWRLVIGILTVLASILLFNFGLLMFMFAMAAVGEGTGFFSFTTIISLGMFIFGFRLIHIWAREWKANQISQIQSTKGPEAVKNLYPKMAILPGGLWRWIVVPVISTLLMLMSGQISLAQRVGYTYFLVALLLLDGIYCVCVRMPHYFLVDGVMFLFGAGYLAHAAFIYFFPGHPSGLRIFSIVVVLLLFHGSLSVWGYWKIRRKRIASCLSIVAVVLICGLFTGVSAADVLYLRNGGRLEGKIVKETDTQITIEMAVGEVGISKSDIKEIERKEFVIKKTSAPPRVDKKKLQGYTGDFMRVINDVDDRRGPRYNVTQEERDTALEKLAAIRDPRAVPALIDLVASTDAYYVRINGLKALGETGDIKALTAGLPDLLRLLNPAKHWSSGEDKAIFYKVLGKCLNEDGVPHFVEFLQAKDKGFTEESFGKVIHIKLSEVEDFTMRRRLFDALTEAEGQDRGLIELYRLVLKHEDPEMRHRAVDKIRSRILKARRIARKMAAERVGEDTPLPSGVYSDGVIEDLMPDLSEHIADEDIDVRRYTANTLLEIQERYKIGPEEAELKEALYARDKKIREYAVKALTLTQTKESITILANFLDEADSGVVTDSIDQMRETVALSGRDPTPLFTDNVENIIILFNCRNDETVRYAAELLARALKHPSGVRDAVPFIKDVLSGKDRNRIIYTLKALKGVKDKSALQELVPHLSRFRRGNDTLLATLSYEILVPMGDSAYVPIEKPSKGERVGFLANLIQRWRAAGRARKMAEQKSKLVKEEVGERVARSRREAAQVVKSLDDQKYESDERENKRLWEEKKEELEALAGLKWKQREITGMRGHRYLKGKIELSDREEKYSSYGIEIKVGAPKDKVVGRMGKHRQVDYKKQGNEEWLTFWDVRTKRKRGDTVVFYIVDDMVKGWITLPAPQDVDDARQECLKFLEQAKYQGLH